MIEFMIVAALLIGIVLAHVLGGNIVAALGVAGLLWIIYALIARLQDRGES